MFVNPITVSASPGFLYRRCMPFIDFSIRAKDFSTVALTYYSILSAFFRTSIKAPRTRYILRFSFLIPVTPTPIRFLWDFGDPLHHQRQPSLGREGESFGQALPEGLHPAIPKTSMSIRG
jgi:hypothetical protein